MGFKDKKSPFSNKDYTNSYTGNVFKIIFLASLIISFSVIITGIVSYSSTKNALMAKFKSEDMLLIIKSMSDKIDGRIQRAMETSFTIARDPVNIEWLDGMEHDTGLGDTVLKRLDDIAVSYDYDSTFISGVKTQHFYFKQDKPKNTDADEVVVLSENNPADVWFFNTLTSKKPISLNVDYDRGMDDTFLFVNTIMGSVDKPVGVAGVGLSLHDISEEFRQFKIGKLSSLWMVDENGIIQLSDSLENRGKHFAELIPSEVVNQINKDLKDKNFDTKVSQYAYNGGEIMDFSYHKLSSCDWILFYQIPRKENISLISSIKINTLFTIIMILFFFVVLFFIISRKIANPYKQALILNMELEKKVDERTQELKKVNHKLMYNAERLAEMNELKDRLFTIVSHDIRDPLAVLVNLTELLEDEKVHLSGDSCEIIDAVKEQVGSTYAMVENLLEWFRSQKGGINFNPLVWKLSQIVQEAVRVLRIKAEAKNIRITSGIGDGIMVFADREALDLVVRNLLSNAVKFTENGGHVCMEAEETDGMVIVSVSDTGVGIEPEKVQMLFNESNIRSSAGTAGEKGTGLGLLICKEFAKHNGGELWVDSTPGRGSTFYFSVPSGNKNARNQYEDRRRLGAG